MTSYDEWYNKWNGANASTACILRVTNQCDQKCKHCAFRSGPECVGQMSKRMCERINAWVPKRVVLNIMGGEFTILDNYPEILVSLARGRRRIRLVTNGFWASDNPKKFFDTMREISAASCQCIDVAVSRDSWHKVSSSLAIQLLKEYDSGITLIETGELDIDNITPIGRAWDNHITPRGHVMYSCESMCNMIITEDGILGRCPYGYFPWKHFSETTWVDAQEYIWGWRSEKLAEGMTCHLCMETVEVAQRGKLNLQSSRCIGEKNVAQAKENTRN